MRNINNVPNNNSFKKMHSSLAIFLRMYFHSTQVFHYIYIVYTVKTISIKNAHMKIDELCLNAELFTNTVT